MKTRIYVKRDDKFYKIATLDYRPRDASIYLFIPNRAGGPGRYGIKEMSVATSENHFSIELADFTGVADFDHSSVHGSGIGHSRPKAGESIHRNAGLPLVELSHPRHLWTMVVPELSGLNEDTVQGSNNIIIDYPLEMNAMVVDLLAFPQGQDINYNLFYDENAQHSTTHSISQAIWEVAEYRVLLISRASDKHSGSPERTIKLAFPDDFVPIVTEISPTTIKGIYAKIVELKRPDVGGTHDTIIK